jgi:hypothetical protein
LNEEERQGRLFELVAQVCDHCVLVATVFNGISQVVGIAFALPFVLRHNLMWKR